MQLGKGVKGQTMGGRVNEAIRKGRRIRQILARVKPLAVEFYRLTGKPLGVTGEVAEYVAAETLRLKLVPARTCGFDALRGKERIQIKGRAFDKSNKRSQRVSRIKQNASCDTVMLVLLDNTTLDAWEIWEVPMRLVRKELGRPGSKARNMRGALPVSWFKREGHRVWSV